MCLINANKSYLSTPFSFHLCFLDISSPPPHAPYKARYIILIRRHLCISPGWHLCLPPFAFSYRDLGQVGISCGWAAVEGEQEFLNWNDLGWQSNQKHDSQPYGNSATKPAWKKRVCKNDVRSIPGLKDDPSERFISKNPHKAEQSSQSDKSL